MLIENKHQTLFKLWGTYKHEDGSCIIDLEMFDPASDEFEPIVAIYGLNPLAVAAGVAAQRTERSIPLNEYVSRLHEPEDFSVLDDNIIYH